MEKIEGIGGGGGWFLEDGGGDVCLGGGGERRRWIVMGIEMGSMTGMVVGRVVEAC